MYQDQSIIVRLVADRHYAFRSPAAAGQAGGHHPTPRRTTTFPHRSYETYRRGRPVRTRGWPG